MQNYTRYSGSTQAEISKGGSYAFYKALSREIMRRIRLRNKFLKERSEENEKKYSKQPNYSLTSEKI